MDGPSSADSLGREWAGVVQGFADENIGTMKYVSRVILLREKNTFVVAFDGDAEKVVKLSDIRHGKFIAE